MPNHSHIELISDDSNTYRLGTRGGNQPSQGNTYTNVNGNIVGNNGLSIYNTMNELGTGYVGGGVAHNNLQPYVVLNAVIKAYEETPLTATVEDTLSSTSTTSALSAYQGKLLNEKVNEIIGTMFGTEDVYFDTTVSYAVDDCFVDPDTYKIYEVTTAFNAGTYATVSAALTAGVIVQGSLLVN